MMSTYDYSNVAMNDASLITSKERKRAAFLFWLCAHGTLCKPSSRLLSKIEYLKEKKIMVTRTTGMFKLSTDAAPATAETEMMDLADFVAIFLVFQVQIKNYIVLNIGNREHSSDSTHVGTFS